MTEKHDLFRDLTVVSLEQAMSLPFLTYRLVQEGARVIRIERPGRGDPNRRVGADVLGDEQRRAYFLPINPGKLAITLNLAEPEGRRLLHDLISGLEADIFCTNNRPGSYDKLGISYPTLSELRPDLIWVGITGYGPDRDEPAYDPIIQARVGWMELTGDPEGEPMQFGLPMVDLGVAEHGYGQIMKALYRRAVTGQGSRIDLAMYTSALAWMASPYALETSFGIPNTRHGNTHQFFAPASVFPTSDGYAYIAIGNDRQWQELTELPQFTDLDRDEYRNNAGRIADVENLNQSISQVTSQMKTDELLQAMESIGVPAGEIRRVSEAGQEAEVKQTLIRSRGDEEGAEMVLPPPPHDTEFLQASDRELSFPPRLGQHNDVVFGELLGRDRSEINRLRQAGII